MRPLYTLQNLFKTTTDYRLVIRDREFDLILHLYSPGGTILQAWTLDPQTLKYHADLFEVLSWLNGFYLGVTTENQINKGVSND